MISGRREFRNEFRSRRRLLGTDGCGVYHVMSRAVGRRMLFGSQEKEVFCALLANQADFAGVEVITYCIMDNHFHLLIRIRKMIELTDTQLLERYTRFYGMEATPQSTYSVDELKSALEQSGDARDVARNTVLARMGRLAPFMQELKQRFSLWFNAKHKSVGTLWASRYKSLLVEDNPESVSTVAAYIDLNPVRAKMVEDPADYRWCGYAAAIAGLQWAQHGLSSIFGESARSFDQALSSYRLILFGKGYLSKFDPGKETGQIPGQFVASVADGGGVVPLQERLRCRIRYFTDGMVLGRKDFVETQFQENRELFGGRRKRGGFAIRGNEWGGLCVMRNLQVDVFGTR